LHEALPELITNSQPTHRLVSKKCLPFQATHFRVLVKQKELMDTATVKFTHLLPGKWKRKFLGSDCINYLWNIKKDAWILSACIWLNRFRVNA
jgi:hypothetical protein